MLKQKKPPARAEHPCGFRHGLETIGNRVQREGAHYRVEPFVGKIQRLGVADAKVDAVT
jgi:hypothetical protein